MRSRENRWPLGTLLCRSIASGILKPRGHFSGCFGPFGVGWAASWATWTGSVLPAVTAVGKELLWPSLTKEGGNHNMVTLGFLACLLWFVPFSLPETSTPPLGMLWDLSFRRRFLSHEFCPAVKDHTGAGLLVLGQTLGTKSPHTVPQGVVL